MGVPADPNVKQFNVYLPVDTIRALKHHAVETEQSLSSVVDAAVVEYLAANDARGREPAVATDGIAGLYIETRNYGATAAFWASLGYANAFETDHGSGQWVHPAGGPYVFIAERHDGDLDTHVILAVADAAAFAPTRAVDYAQPFTPQHWGVTEALVRDPDGHVVSLQAPLPAGAHGPDAGEHHAEKYGR